MYITQLNTKHDGIVYFAKNKKITRNILNLFQKIKQHELSLSNHKNNLSTLL